jgi:hypothetical protein
VFETYRMLGEQRQQELHREAQRLAAGRKRSRTNRPPSARRLRAIAAWSVSALATVRHAVARNATAIERPG